MTPRETATRVQICANAAKGRRENVYMGNQRDPKVEEQLWKDPDWTCPHCQFVNFAIREKCRNCSYDSNAGEFPWYNPLPPYDGLPKEEERPPARIRT